MEMIEQLPRRLRDGSDMPLPAQLSTLAAAPEPELWPQQGEWTYGDYRRLPDDGWRYEVIRGVLYMSPAPDTQHQTVVSNLLFLLRLFLREHPIARALTAPTDVLLPGLTEPVQPDLLMVKNERRDLFKKRYVEGSPDLVIEVLSPSNWLNDRRVKYAAYAEAGVAEYWIVDPQQETVEVFVLRDGSYELLGEYSSGEQVRSETLSGFEPAVDEIFADG